MGLNPILRGLSCFACKKPHDAKKPQRVCESCGMPLRVDYWLDAVMLTPRDLSTRASTLWRYREMLPVVDGEVTLGEGWTPLVQVDEHLYIKDEAQNPTGSFKARGMSVAVTMAQLLGAESLCAPSAGNAAGALAAYGARAGLAVYVCMPEDTPWPFVEECRHYGAEVKLLPGTIADCGKWMAENAPLGAIDVSTLKEPYRVEGKKTMGYELFEQLHLKLPDVIVYPTGGGTGLVGMWKAFDEMERLGWIGKTRPRLVSVQAAGCAPVVKAYEESAARTEPWPDPQTKAYGLRVPDPIGGFLCLRALRQTGGIATSVPETAIAPAARELARRSGCDVCPEAGAAWSATRRLRDEGWIRPGEDVVIFNTGTGLKYR